MSAHSKNSIILNGKEISCVPFGEGHIHDRYVSWMNDPEINCFLESRFSQHTLEGLHENYLKISGRNNVFFWAIQTTSGDLSHIGNIKLSVNLNHLRGEVGIIIGDKKYWGKGMATMAIELVTIFAFNSLGLHKLTAGAYANNIGSVKAFLKAGFKIEYLIKEHFYINNSYEDCTVMSVLRRNWGHNDQNW